MSAGTGIDVTSSRCYAPTMKLCENPDCAKEFQPWPGRPGRFCSRQCANVGISRETAVRRGDALRGRGEGKSYPKLNGRHAHRVIAEEVIGRPLQPGETVHHRNGNKLDFSAENLVVLQSQAEHAKIHSTKNRTCEVEGCDRKHMGRGLCRLHHYRKYKSSPR